MIYSMEYSSPVGALTLAAEDGHLVGLWIQGQKYYGATLREPPVPREDPVLKQAADWLDRYFAGAQPDPRELPLAPSGSSFRQAVYKILLEIPYGAVTTYGEIAKEIAKKRGIQRFSAQAVGGAVGHNPISIIIPCHRVVGTNGSLTGYAGGIAAKQKLLTLEGVDVAAFTLPKSSPPSKTAPRV